MTSRKARNKDRRQAERLMDDAWRAEIAGEESLARKLARQATDAGPMNARLWHDLGLIEERMGDLVEAERAFRTAIARAAGEYGEARASLDRVRLARGKRRAALDAMPLDAEQPPELTIATERFAWDQIERDLRARGLARLPQLIDAAACAALRKLAVGPPDELGATRFEVASRLDDPILALHCELYARAAAIERRWCEELGRTHPVPATLDGLLRSCERHRQTRSAVALWQLAAGARVGPRHDACARMWAMFGLWVALGPDGGLRFELIDEQPGKRPHAHSVLLEPGDAVLHCTRDRPVPIAGVTGLQPVVHALDATRGPCWGLALPFHHVD